MRGGASGNGPGFGRTLPQVGPMRVVIAEAVLRCLVHHVNDAGARHKSESRNCSLFVGIHPYDRKSECKPSELLRSYNPNLTSEGEGAASMCKNSGVLAIMEAFIRSGY